MIGRPERNPNLAWREIDGEVVIISPEDSQVHELNETASLIWKHADGTHGLEEITAQVAAVYDVAPEAARTDVAELIAQLDEKRLLISVAEKG
jgi:Coenzyme PQQ synthesis protein D (PqqD)